MKQPNTPRKQHFVPQFYLRNFSSDEAGSIISSYNHKTGQFYIDVPIKSQAYKDYVYGEDGEIEKELSTVEAKFAKLISNPIDKILPPDNQEDFNLLCLFVLIQHSRTVKAGADILNAVNTSFNAIRPFLQLKQPIPEGGRISHKIPAALSLNNALESRYLMGHLAVKSIVNLSLVEFILSDNPIIPYNIWMENQGSYIGATALASKGLLLFVPIAPRLMYCFYDPYIYEFGEPNKGTVKTESEADVNQLNILQYLFSDKQLFFNKETLPPEYLVQIAEQNQHLCIDDKYISRVFKTGNEFSKDAYTLLSSVKEPHIGLSLPFIRITAQGLIENITNGLPEVRHPDFHKEREKRRSENHPDRPGQNANDGP